MTLIYWKLRILMARNNWENETLLGRTTLGIEEGWQAVENVLRRARQDAESGGHRLIVFPVPTGQEFVADFPNEQYRSRLLSLTDRLGIEHVDPTPVMKAAGGGFHTYFVTWDGHINERAHDVIARLLAQRIASPAAAMAGVHAAPPTRP